MVPARADPPPLARAVLPDGIGARFVDNGNGLRMHLLEAGAGTGRPLLLLLHGFPELAYSWRKIMPPLASAGYHVVAPDQRGYGRTTGGEGADGGDPADFRMLRLVRDVIGLLPALGQRAAAAVIGHDFGAPVAAWCALLRPDLFPALVLMSAPFAGPPTLATTPGMAALDAALAALVPPRKHYQWYYSSPAAAAEMEAPAEGMAAFLRAYYHMKSADWPGNRPARLASSEAAELARMPRYYIMDRGGASMPATVAAARPSPAEIAACRWLPEHELAVYAGEFARTGFQGGLHWYRCATAGIGREEMQIFAGRAITVKTLFIAGAADWGVYQAPGGFERMQTIACADFRGAHLIAGAGHWVQQEQPDAVVARLRDFLG